MVVIGRGGCIWAKVVVFGQKCLIRAKRLYSGKSCCIRAKVVVFVQNICIRAKLLYSGKLVVCRQGDFIRQ